MATTSCAVSGWPFENCLALISVNRYVVGLTCTQSAIPGLATNSSSVSVNWSYSSRLIREDSASVENRGSNFVATRLTPNWITEGSTGLEQPVANKLQAPKKQRTTRRKKERNADATDEILYTVLVQAAKPQRYQSFAPLIHQTLSFQAGLMPLSLFLRLGVQRVLHIQIVLTSQRL